MKEQDINAAIVKYYEGSLSINEEDTLINFLKNNNDPRYADIKLQINVMDSLFDNEDMLDSLFDEKILEKLTKPEPKKSSRYNVSKILSGVAAIALILISIWITSGILEPRKVYGTVTDPVVAFNEAKKALQKVSGNIKKGITPAAKSIKKIETGLEKSGKIKEAAEAINNIQKINRLNKAGYLLKSMTKVTVKCGKQ